jgi:hypothetical protein
VNKRKIGVVLGIAVLLFLAACAGPNSLAHTPNSYVAGFFMGLWNGMTFLFAFIFSLFNDHIQVYEVHNNGGWYNFGFLLGISMAFGGGSAASR